MSCCIHLHRIHTDNWKASFITATAGRLRLTSGRYEPLKLQGDKSQSWLPDRPDCVDDPSIPGVSLSISQGQILYHILFRRRQQHQRESAHRYLTASPDSAVSARSSRKQASAGQICLSRRLCSGRHPPCCIAADEWMQGGHVQAMAGSRGRASRTGRNIIVVFTTATALSFRSRETAES